MDFFDHISEYRLDSKVWLTTRMVLSVMQTFNQVNNILQKGKPQE